MAEKYKITREEQDEFAVNSHRKAISAIKECRFKSQIVPVELQSKKRELVVFDKDESPREDTTVESLRALKPAFKKDGTVTAGNAPGVNDGAAAVVVTSYRKAQELGAKPMARIVAQATSGVEPKWVMMAPVDAVRQIWKKTGWKNEEVDLYELNEAFSVQALGVSRELGLDMNKVNVNGGAVALGHPIGASGARVLVTLLYEMIRRDVHKGIAALCLGGGNAVAMASSDKEVEEYRAAGPVNGGAFPLRELSSVHPTFPWNYFIIRQLREADGQLCVAVRAGQSIGRSTMYSGELGALAQTMSIDSEDAV